MYSTLSSSGNVFIVTVAVAHAAKLDIAPRLVVLQLRFLPELELESELQINLIPNPDWDQALELQGVPKFVTQVIAPLIFD